MTPTMPADRKQVEEAVERLRLAERKPMVAVASLDGEVREPLVCLTPQERDTLVAALATRVPREPTDAMLKSAFVAMNATPGGEWKRMKAAGQTARQMFDAKMRPRWTAMWDAAHQQPAPVKAGGEGDHA